MLLTLSLRGIVLIAMLSCGAAFAEEVQIGHLVPGIRAE
jgi:hypothetical protein